MDTHQQHEQEQKQPSDRQKPQAFVDTTDSLTGVTVIRNNTPRPLSFALSTSKIEDAPPANNTGSGLADFPVEAPAAPPVPEEPEESQRSAPVPIAPISLATPFEQSGATVSEFTWLFEYGLEMDEAFLNSPHRLNGQAHLYGPAVLKGYRLAGRKLTNGQTVITLAGPTSLTGEVWGVLFRIPRRLIEQNGPELSELDKFYAARHFTATSVVVQEMYHRRMVQCTTYMLSESVRKDDFSSSPVDVQFDRNDARHLLEVARQQHLPEVYIQGLAILTGQTAEMPPALVPPRIEQNTEPLPLITSGALAEYVPAPTRNTAAQPTPRGWLLALALYLVGILMATLALAVVQTLGYWNQFFSANFALLGAPEYVLLYGLLGGCISCIMALGRSSRPTWPGFVLLTWFVRPFLGMALAALAYLALSSGFFAISAMPAQRYAICSVVGAIAGLCEGWLFFRHK